MIKLFGQDFDLENPQSTFFCGDCVEGMRKFPNKYFDLAICDPPYGINIGNEIGGGQSQTDTLRRKKKSQIQIGGTNPFGEKSGGTQKAAQNLQGI